MISSQPDETSSAPRPTQTDASRQPDESWRWALEASGAGCWTWDARTNISTWDDSFRALYQISADSPPRIETWLDRMHPDDRSRLRTRIEQFLATPDDTRWSEAYRSVSSDGHVRWHQTIGQGYRDASGALLQMAGIVLDITARTEAEDEAREKDAQLVLIQRHYPGLVARLDRDLRYVYASPRYEEWFGVPASDVIGRTMADVIGPGPYAVAAPFAARALAGETVTFENEIALPTGRRFWLQATFVPVTYTDGAVPGLFVFATDITERKQAAEVLAETQSRQNFLLQLSDALSPLTDPLAIQEAATRLLCEHLGVNRVTYADVDGDEFVVRWSHATGVEPLRGRNLIPRLGEHLFDQPHQTVTVAVNDVESDPRLSDDDRARMRSVQSVAGVRQTLVREGRAVAIVIVNQITPRLWTEREISLIEQVTERIFHEGERLRAERERAAYLKELEHQSQLLRRLASQLTLAEQDAREQLAKVIHNHLQQVLFSARLRQQRLTARLAGASASDLELLGHIGHDVDEAIATTRSLVTELFPPMLHDAGLPAALAWLQAWAHQNYGLIVHLQVDPAANPEARDVRTLLFESVKELVFNAVKHASVDRLTIELALTEGENLRLVIADDGAGFDPEALLAAGRTQGTGFGLLAIRERLASIGGRLEIDAAPGHGARFTLTVPRGLAPSPEATSSPQSASQGTQEGAGPVTPAGRPLRILLADDHALVRDGLRQLLADHPGLLIVGEAADGIEAVALARDLHPDVVIMDVSMPRMNGVEATRLIRTASPDVEVLGLSTEERHMGRHAIEDAGAAGYFTKGDDARRLLERLLETQTSASFRG